MRKQLKLAVLALGALTALGGCRDAGNDFYKEGKIGGYSAAAVVDYERKFSIWDGNGVEDPRIFATDFDKDGRFDEIRFRNVPKGHPLEAYASLDELEQAYNSIVNKQ